MSLPDAGLAIMAAFTVAPVDVVSRQGLPQCLQWLLQSCSAASKGQALCLSLPLGSGLIIATT